MYVPSTNATDLLKNFLNTPDNRPGWASYLLSHSYTVFLLDTCSRGRSPHHPSHGSQITYPSEFISQRFTAIRSFSLWPQAALHTQWPGTGLIHDPVYDAYYSSTVPSLANMGLEQELMRAAGASLLDRIGPAILLTHSQGGTHGWLWADVRPQLVKAIVAVEPTGPPFSSMVVKERPMKSYGITDIPLTFEPPANSPADDGNAPLDTETHPASDGDSPPCVLQAEPARRLVNLSRIPVLLETGEASAHAGYDDYTVRFLRQAGVYVEHLKLADVGIRGNGHMQFLEKNNLEIIEVLERWITKIE